MTPDQISMLARMANGSFGRALALASNEELLNHRQLILDFIRVAYTRHVDKLADLVEEMARLGRERLKGLLGLMLSWIHDLMIYRITRDAELLVNIDQIETVERFCTNVPDARLDAMVALVEQAVELIGRNVHVQLVLIVLADRLSEAMRGGSVERLYVPLHDAPAMVDA